MKFDSSFYLRVGLAFIFIFAAVSGFIIPEAWVGFVPSFIGAIIDRSTFLLMHGIVNLIIGLWLISGKKVFYAAVLASINLAAITIANMGVFLIVFRDVGLFFAAVALALMSKGKK